MHGHVIDCGVKSENGVKTLTKHGKPLMENVFRSTVCPMILRMMYTCCRRHGTVGVLFEYWSPLVAGKTL